MARTTKQATTAKGSVAVECEGCLTTFPMDAAVHANLIAERQEFTCPNGCRRRFLAPQRSFVDLFGAVVALQCKVQTSLRELPLTSAASTSALEAAEEKLARALRELAEIKASLNGGTR